MVTGVLSRVLGQLGAGVGSGIAFMWLLRLTTSLVVTWDALLAVSALTVGAGAIACLWPTFRAARAHPMDAIRVEG